MAAERTVDAYVAALPDGQREIAEAVRRLVRSAAPDAAEVSDIDEAVLAEMVRDAVRLNAEKGAASRPR